MSMTIEQITSALPNVAKLETKAGQELIAQMLEQMQGMRVEREELKGQVVSLAVENAGLKSWATNRAKSDDSLEQENYSSLVIDWRERQLAKLETPATDAAIASIQAQGVEMLANSYDERVKESAHHMIINRCKVKADQARDFAAQLRKGAAV